MLVNHNVNNVYDFDKRHPATAVKQENPDVYKINNFNLDYLKLSIKKNISNHLYL